MMGAMLRRCFPVELKPTMVRMPPMVGPFKSPPTAITKKVAKRPLIPMLNRVAAIPSSLM